MYRFVMDCCLEKKIYDRQINKQGMADRVVDECNPDAVLSMKEITNLCFDNDDKVGMFRNTKYLVTSAFSRLGKLELQDDDYALFDQSNILELEYSFPK